MCGARLPSMLNALVGLVALVAIVGVLIWGLLAGGAATSIVPLLIGGGITYAIAHFQERERYQRDLDAKIATDKAVLYKMYLDILRDMFDASGGKVDARTMAPILKRLNRFVFGSLLIASDDVVLAHDRFMRASKISDQMVLPAVADVIVAMRRDIGKAPTSLRPIDTLAAFVRDIDSLAPAFEQWAREKDSTWPVPAGAAKPSRARGQEAR